VRVGGNRSPATDLRDSTPYPFGPLLVDQNCQKALVLQGFTGGNEAIGSLVHGPNGPFTEVGAL